MVPGYLFVKAEDVVCLREAIWRAGGAEVAERRAGAGEIASPTGASGGGGFHLSSWLGFITMFSRQ